MSTIYTVGHSTRTAEAFQQLLHSAGIDLLIDVRRYPGSRRHPQFSRDDLSTALAAEGITYMHIPELGGRRASDADSPNTYWRNVGFRAYADYMSTPEFAAALRRVEALSQAHTAAIMCAEAVPWRCHRQLVADALVARGHEVRHILSEKRAEEHALNPAARIDGQGRIRYPAGEPQPSLFDPREG